MFADVKRTSLLRQKCELRRRRVLHDRAKDGGILFAAKTFGFQVSFRWRHDIQQNDTQLNDIQQNGQSSDRREENKHYTLF